MNKQKRPNQDIRKFISASKVFNYQVAEQLSIGENTFYRMLRRQLTDEEKKQIIKAVEAVKIENLVVPEQVKITEVEKGSYFDYPNS